VTRERRAIEIDSQGTLGPVTEPPVRHDAKEYLRARPKLISWVTKSGFALLDQGLITGSNFVMSILLARWWAPQAYGAYAVGFAVFLLILMLYQSLMLEPMSVFGGSAYRNCLRGYLKSLLVFHFGASAFILVVMFVAAAVVLRSNPVSGFSGALAGVGLAAPAVLLLWLAKRMFYLELSPAPAAGGALLYFVLLLGSLTLAHQFHILSPFSAFLITGIAALAGSSVLLMLLKAHLSVGEDPPPSLRDAWRRHWQYGRWALAGSAFTWIPNYMFYPLVGSFCGMRQAGELKALMNFSAPVLQGYGALATLLLPYAARTQQNQGCSGSYALMCRISLISTAGAILYWCPLLLFKSSLFRLTYSGGYAQVAYLLPIAAIASIFWSAFLGPATALRAMESTAQVFAALFISSVVSVMIGIPAIRAWGVGGALSAIALSEAIAFLMAFVLLQRKMRRASQEIPVAPALTTTE